MARTQVTIKREDLIDLVDTFQQEMARRIRKAELDARVIGKLHTFYGHRPSTYVSFGPQTIRRVSELIRGV